MSKTIQESAGNSYVLWEAYERSKPKVYIILLYRSVYFRPLQALTLHDLAADSSSSILVRPT